MGMPEVIIIVTQVASAFISAKLLKARGLFWFGFILGLVLGLIGLAVALALRSVIPPQTTLCPTCQRSTIEDAKACPYCGMVFNPTPGSAH